MANWVNLLVARKFQDGNMLPHGLSDGDSAATCISYSSLTSESSSSSPCSLTSSSSTSFSFYVIVALEEALGSLSQCQWFSIGCLHHVCSFWKDDNLQRDGISDKLPLMILLEDTLQDLIDRMIENNHYNFHNVNMECYWNLHWVIACYHHMPGTGKMKKLYFVEIWSEWW